jgi:hypothetical protein
MASSFYEQRGRSHQTLDFIPINCAVDLLVATGFDKAISGEIAGA